jgi:hypothetical protein
MVGRPIPFCLKIRRSLLGAAGGLLIGILLAGCADVPAPPEAHALASVGQIDRASGSITLTSKAIARIGIQTTQVRASKDGNVIPHGALIYDSVGDTFAYTNTAPRVYSRQRVQVKAIRGDEVVLASGPAAGALVVSVGAPQLLGFELGIGS